MTPAETTITGPGPSFPDIENQGSDYLLCLNGKALLTPAGHPVRHENFRLIHLIFSSLLHEENAGTLSALACFTYSRDIFPARDISFALEIKELCTEDPILQGRLYKEQRPGLAPGLSPDFLVEHPDLMTLFFSTGMLLQEAFNHLLSDGDFLLQQAKESIGDQVLRFLSNHYQLLNEDERAMLQLLHQQASCGLILPLLLIRSHISPFEFAAGSLMRLYNKASLPALPHEELHGFLLGESLKYRQMAQNAREYLDVLSNFRHEQKKALESITAGEGESTEFKSTLRWNIKEGKKDSAIEHACLKTLCAFINTKGGTLFIGVADNGSITGIETDGFENHDKFYIHLWNLIKNQLGEEFTPFVQSSLISLQGKTICKVACMAGTQPVFLLQKGLEDEFFIRTGPATTRLGVGDAYKYIKQRFGT